MDITFEAVREVIVDALSCEADEVKPETNLYEDLEVDSLEAVELSLALKDALGVGIDDGDLEQIKTVSDILEYLKAKQQKQ